MSRNRRSHASGKKRGRLSLEHLERRDLMVAEFRTIDGSGNNIANPDWGEAGNALLRYVPAQYADGFNSPTGADRPSPRAISNAVVAQSGSIESKNLLTTMVFQWGQFIDHDLDLSNGSSPSQPFNITVPTGDAFFDPLSTGTKTIGLNRSEAQSGTGVPDNPRQQINSITSYIDASQVYGSDATRAAALRSFVGGKLKIGDDGLMITNTFGLPNGQASPNDDPAKYYFGGDVRVNEQLGLASMHTLFVREHNRLADQLAAENPTWTDEEIYLHARRLVGAEIQAITYNEFLPAVLGPNGQVPDRGYDPNTNAGITNEFSTAAFRVGHTMLPSSLLRLDANGQFIPQGSLELRNAFFNPDELEAGGGIDPILRGLAEQFQQEIDVAVVDDVRNFLFGPPGAGGFDLASLNIQRGRDHGLGSYNETRVALGLPAVTSFAEISSDVSVQTKLASVYNSVDDVDLWVGGLAEDHVPGGNLGETFAKIWIDQFDRLRAGDRFYYERDLSPAEVSFVNSMTLAEIIKANTSIDHIQENVFRNALTVEFRHVNNSSTSVNLFRGTRVDLLTVGSELQLVNWKTREIYLTADVNDISGVYINGQNGGSFFQGVNSQRDIVTVFLPENGYQPNVYYAGGAGENDEIIVIGSNHGDLLKLNSDTLFANNATFSIQGVESVRMYGRGGNDRFVIIGTQNREVALSGESGNDTFSLGATGASTYRISDGGNNGTDLLNFVPMKQGVNVDLSKRNGVEQDLPGDGKLRVYSQFERLIGTNFADVLAGNSLANYINARGGDDLVYGRGGDDVIYAGAGDDVVFGEVGNDIIYGQVGNDILHGGRGIDNLFGQGGRDLLIGGLDSDFLRGDADEDIYVSGDTTYDQNIAALSAILNEWVQPIPAGMRIVHLQGGVGLNNDIKLVPNLTLINDNVIDWLYSNARDMDWLLFNAGDQTSFV